MLKRVCRRRDDDERGAAFVLTAMSMVLLLWAGATGVDVGFTVYGSRQAQAMADTAALDLVRYISYADTLTSIPAVQSYLNGKLTTVLADNASNANLAVVPGYFNSSTKVFTVDGITGTSCQPVIAPPINRPGCNAVEVTANQTVPQIFFGGFNTLSAHGNGSGTSLAWNSPAVGFSIGTYLVNLNTQQSKVLNALLSPLGSSVNLTAVSYAGLATADVTLKDLINASGGLLSSTNILTASLTAGQWLSIYQSAVGSDFGTGSTAYTSLQALGAFSMAQSTDVKLCQMVNVNVGSAQYGTSCLPQNSSISQQGLNASVNVLQMLTTEAELANGTNGINVTSALNLSVAGVTLGNVMLQTTVISPAQTAYGPVGTTASDAQVQTTLTMNLTVPILGTPIGSLSIPLSAATGTVTLNTMTCNSDSLFSTALNVNTSAVSTGSSGQGVTLTLLGITTTQGSLSVNGLTNKGVTFTGPANPSGATIPPTPTTATNGTNPETVGSTSPSMTFTAAGGANGSATATMNVVAGMYGPVLQALGLTVAGATVAGYQPANCDSISLS